MDAGLGLFVAANVPKGAKITRMAGECLTARELHARYHYVRGCPTVNLAAHQYVLSRSANNFIDCSNPWLSSIARFINHLPSDDPRRNCRFTPRANVLSLRALSAGEELFISYGTHFSRQMTENNQRTLPPLHTPQHIIDRLNMHFQNNFQ